MNEPQSEQAPAPDDPLAAARADIDAIDDRLLDLVQQRAAIADRLAALKPSSGAPVRPAREVALLRRLISRAQGVDADAVIDVWRGLIGSNIRRQRPIEILVGGAGPETLRLFDFSRRHFGASAKITRADDARAALSRVLESPTTLAVVPYPGASGAGAWWPILNETRFRAVTLISALPLLAEAGQEPEAAIVAQGVTPEPAGGDVTFAVAFDPHHRAVRAFNEAAIIGREVARSRETILARLEGFFAPGDPRIATLVHAGLDGFRVVGSYARI
jgi:chorismate mutase